MARQAPSAASSLASDRPLAGIALMALGVTIVPTMDAIAKYLSADYSILQIAWARFAFHSLWLLPLVLWYFHPRDLIARHPGLQVLRGLFLLGATICFFTAISFMPIADALALLFISPMVCTTLSPIFLGDRVGPWRWVAVFTGFLGALIVIQPGFGVFQWASMFALAAGFLHGGYLLTTRRVSGAAPPLISLCYSAFVGLIAMSFVAPFVWTPPTPTVWGLFALMGLIAALGHFLIIKSFERAPAPVVAPVAYTEIVAATIVGYVVFSDFPDAGTWLGIAVIVGSGVVISIRERTQAPPKMPPTDTSAASH